MCGRASSEDPAAIYAEFSHLKIDPQLEIDFVPRYNLAPGQRILVMRRSREGLRLDAFGWGLIPEAWISCPQSLHGPRPDLEMHQANLLVNNVKNDSPELLVP